ncbi:MAG TPA: YdcF family protein [Clostridia bacterium]|nr:YdcF family protein [Clostridia bacterium]
MILPSSKAKGRPWLRWFLSLLLGALIIFYLVTCLRIVHQSQIDEARRADVIIVFGAAEYAGKPSPVFRARLDHGYSLYERKLAPVVLTTGGAGNDPYYTEGGVGRDYLNARGISDRHLIAETQGDNTAESAERVAIIMRANGMKDCVAVSDAYHLFRIKQLMARHGITVYTSPRPQIPMTTWVRVQTVLREALSLTLWKLHIT